MLNKNLHYASLLSTFAVITCTVELFVYIYIYISFKNLNDFRLMNNQVLLDGLWILHKRLFWMKSRCVGFRSIINFFL